ncbi:MAG: PEP-CTERM sorting domain-containing protein, partial [Phycisphaerales bacterium]|nr:PEP-CTERM sorting domain-containing protein [Phycisphaerales bacterium]
NGLNQTINTLISDVGDGGIITNSNAGITSTLTLNNNTITGFNGTIESGILLRKTSGNTLTLTGDTTYSCDIEVTNGNINFGSTGTATFTGSFTGSTAVTTGTLSGTGPISSRLTLNTTAHGAPGVNGIGLQQTGELFFSSGSYFDCYFGDAADSDLNNPGVSNRYKVTNAMSVPGAASGQNYVSLCLMTPDAITNGIYQLIDFAGSSIDNWGVNSVGTIDSDGLITYTGSGNKRFQLDADTWSVLSSRIDDDSAANFSIFWERDKGIYLSINGLRDFSDGPGIPEPASLALLSLGTATLFLRRRK